VLETYAKALEQLNAASDAAARNEQQLRLIRDAPDALQTLKVELAKPVSESPELSQK